MMGKLSFQQHKFDELIRLVVTLALISVAVVLMVLHSPYAQGVVGLIIGMVIQRYLGTPYRQI